MKGLLAALVGLAVAMSVTPAAAYVAEITTSIPIESVGRMRSSRARSTPKRALAV
jgi:hypothetical protein